MDKVKKNNKITNEFIMSSLDKTTIRKKAEGDVNMDIINEIAESYAEEMEWDEGMLSHPSDYFTDTIYAIKDAFPELSREEQFKMKDLLEAKIVDLLSGKKTANIKKAEGVVNMDTVNTGETMADKFDKLLDQKEYFEVEDINESATGENEIKQNIETNIEFAIETDMPNSIDTIIVNDLEEINNEIISGDYAIIFKDDSETGGVFFAHGYLDKNTFNITSIYVGGMDFKYFGNTGNHINQLHKKAVKIKDYIDKAEPTSRVLPDYMGDLTEWSQPVILEDGTRGTVFYYTDEKDAKMVEEAGGDEGLIDWEDAESHVIIDGKRYEIDKYAKLKKRAGDGYQGWTNYETWSVNLWLTSEPDTVSTIDGVIDELKTNAPGEDDIDDQGIKEDMVYKLSEWIKDYVEDNSPLNDQASMYSDLLNGAISVVNYREIAENWLDAE